MDSYKDLIRGYLAELGVKVLSEGERTLVCQDLSEGINNLILFVDDPILILEQHIANSDKLKPGYEKELLRRNNSLVHGAFVLDNKDRVVWKDTLRLENLDLNELEGSIKALSMSMVEHSQFFLNQRA
ncbi:molecular chaperone Tir [Pseudobacteriovorax antillogorgiicola]|uniref:Molecular chaperone Tir n=1 Tax=Pseudobacteriovorax antillogorgiicola TaxID=1513793 RepID=A0A1Y6CWK6_9BACT|nr:molecular chaperone Tir [Pseudobacteriovorax antillogorgiicola]TCS41264.1 hypothetical protein EDD56_1498 [Pseudobacteriovorax antillogorgiicola]SMF83768.1 hypothetical protein SAMN06296036_1498 [Pseudobacteriovorax antillogorgiicola]